MVLSRRVSLASNMTCSCPTCWVYGSWCSVEKGEANFEFWGSCTSCGSSFRLQAASSDETTHGKKYSAIPNLPIQRQTINPLFSLLLCFVWSLSGYVSHASGSCSLFRVALGQKVATASGKSVRNCSSSTLRQLISQYIGAARQGQTNEDRTLQGNRKSSIAANCDRG